MLEKVNLDEDLSREEFKKILPDRQRRLFELEKTCWDNQVHSVVVFEGWDAAGKGSAIATLTERLDARGFRLHQIEAPRTFEQNRPWLWRFWMRTPNRGEMAIFDRSWYSRVLEERVEKLIPEHAWRAAYRDIVEFERMLADDGVVIVKFWLHISKKEQKRRFREIEKDPLESWRIGKADWARHRKYDRYLVAAEEMLELTDSEIGPWTIVEATSKWFARKKVLDTVIRALEYRLGDLAPPHHPVEESDVQLREALEAAELTSKLARGRRRTVHHHPASLAKTHARNA